MKLKNNNGITLIALVITIIVLLILAGVSINMITGNDGIISKASNAAEKTKTNSSDEEQKLKDTSAHIDEKVNQAGKSDSSLSHSGTVPEGAYYANLNTGTFYDVMPDTLSDNDVYLYEDYLYMYSSSDNGWSVVLATEDLGISAYVPNFVCTDRDQTSYAPLLESINGVAITSLDSTFNSCTSLVTVPNIPSSIINMSHTFDGCSALVDASNIIIPKGVTSLYGTFTRCSSLKILPNLPNWIVDMNNTFSYCNALTDLSTMVIPEGVDNMYQTFYKCANLTIAPIIPNTVTNMGEMFYLCRNLTTVPNVSENVDGMPYAFCGCTSLKNVNFVINKCTNLNGVFDGCIELSGNITINSFPNYGYNRCFSGVDFDSQDLHLAGTSTKLDYIGLTGNNYCMVCNGKCDNNH